MISDSASRAPLDIILEANKMDRSWICLWQLAGGTFALYSKLCQHARVGQTAGRHHSPLQSDAQLKFYGSRSRTRGIHSGVKLFLERTRWEQMALLLLVMTGTSMVIGDGVLTPAISGQIWCPPDAHMVDHIHACFRVRTKFDQSVSSFRIRLCRWTST